MAGWPEPRGSMGMSYFWASHVLFPSKEKHQRVQQKPQGWARTLGSCLAGTCAAHGALLAEMLLGARLVVLQAQGALQLFLG